MAEQTTSPQPSPSQGEGAEQGALATLPRIEDLSSINAEIQVLFELLAFHDRRFGINGYRSCRLSDRAPEGHAIYDGWQHPALQTFMASKGYPDHRCIAPHDLRAIAWNLQKKLAEFEGSDR
ncbi:MAG: hypothetical protein AAGI44_05915 [Pseudomonadota bacterium]